MEKTYIVVRSDIPPGLQLAQACHAAIAFTAEHGVLSDNLVVLQAPSKEDLAALAYRARGRLTLFLEPDLDDELTAIALDDSARPLLSSLPLALREAQAA